MKPRTFSIIIRMVGIGIGTLPSAAFAAPHAVAQLLSDTIQVMAEMNVPLGFNTADLLFMSSESQELLDPKTGGPYRTASGKPLPYFVIEPEGCLSDEPRTVLFVGGLHPSEVSPLYSSFLALKALLADPKTRPPGSRLIYVPLSNPDGLIRGFKARRYPTRGNLLGVDLNRNFGVAEPQNETRFLQQLIERYRPSHVISLHGPLGWVDYDGPLDASTTSYTAEEMTEVQHWLERISKGGRKTLPLNTAFGVYPGSLGEYAGHKLDKHVVTIEYPGLIPAVAKAHWKDYGGTVLESLKTFVPAAASESTQSVPDLVGHSPIEDFANED